jgi:riboflavin biosynthesis pyrimidine reductase
VDLIRLHPAPGTITPDEAVAGLAGTDTLAVNMVASADGRAALSGKTAALSDEADREVFHTLRAQADAILVGTGTLRDERYGRFARSERRIAQRRAHGLADEPLGVIMTRSMDLPYDIPLFQDPEARIAVYTDSVRPLEATPADVSVTLLEDLGPRAVIDHLRQDHRVRCVLCEGGPTLNHALFSSGVVDELFLTLSPLLAGGADPLTIIEGDIPHPLALELLQAIEHAGSLLLRYRLRRDG